VARAGCGNHVDERFADREQLRGAVAEIV